MNDETEEAKIVEVEEPVTIDESQPAIVDVTGNEAEADGEPVSQGLSEEELDKRRDKTQKRINKLVAQRKETEEREAAALQFAQQQKSEADALRAQLSSLNTGYSAEASSRIDSQEAQAKAAGNVEGDFILRPGEPPISFNKGDILMGGTQLGMGGSKIESLLEELLAETKAGKVIKMDTVTVANSLRRNAIKMNT